VIEAGTGRWVVLVVRVPGTPSRHRVAVWRELRRIGAVSLGQGAWLVPDVPVFAVDMYDHTLPWALKRTVTLVGYRDELGDAVDWEREKFVPDLMTFVERWNAAPQAWAILPVGEAEKLPRELGIRVQVMARGPQYAIVRKP